MAIISPSILATDPHTFRSQLERVEPFAKRIQIDLSDGAFTPTRTIQPDAIYWPENLIVDLHLMYSQPSTVLDVAMLLKPDLVILHAESQEELGDSFAKLKNAGIKTGLAVLPATTIESVATMLSTVDHLLIFAGTLGGFSDHNYLKQLAKVTTARSINPNLEIGWDGGANDTNVKTLADGGVDVITVGGYIQHSDTPQEAYAILESLI